jgi:hypothetical protein
MRALVGICTANGQETLSVTVEDGDPYVVLRMRDAFVPLTRTESRKVADALRAGALRDPYQP